LHGVYSPFDLFPRGSVRHSALPSQGSLAEELRGGIAGKRRLQKGATEELLGETMVVGVL
jgi:hypothetical protein